MIQLCYCQPIYYSTANSSITKDYLCSICNYQYKPQRGNKRICSTQKIQEATIHVAINISITLHDMSHFFKAAINQGDSCCLPNLQFSVKSSFFFFFIQPLYCLALRFMNSENHFDIINFFVWKFVQLYFQTILF